VLEVELGAGLERVEMLKRLLAALLRLLAESLIVGLEAPSAGLW
jgi:hypothetical protein